MANAHLEEGFLLVTKALTEDGEGAATLSEPKAAASRRRVELDPDTVTILRTLRLAQEAEGYPGPMVFAGPQGGYLSRHNIRNRVLLPALEAADLPRVTFHSLRHVVNTALASEGVNLRVLQQRLGHATSRMTMDTYLHLTRGAVGAAARVAGELLRP